MDVFAIAAQVTEFLSPLLPKILDGAGKKVGEVMAADGITKAKTVFGLLTKAPNGDAVLEKAKQLAAAPNNEKARNDLDDAITGLLKRNADLLEKVADALADGTGGNTVIASGRGAVAIGGNANGAQINTGNMGKS
jgi:hypothetical protein